jgi:hypothetical protein
LQHENEYQNAKAISIFERSGGCIWQTVLGCKILERALSTVKNRSQCLERARLILSIRFKYCFLFFLTPNPNRRGGCEKTMIENQGSVNPLQINVAMQMHQLSSKKKKQSPTYAKKLRATAQQ